MSISFQNTVLPDVIELRDIRQVYPDKKTGQDRVVIDGFNLLIEDIQGRGQFIVILGESGCGKSTVLRHIAGIQKPTSGEILIFGKKREEEVKVGMVFQQYSSFPWYTVLQNVMLPLVYSQQAEHSPKLKFLKAGWQLLSPIGQLMKNKEIREKAMEMIKLVGLEGHENKFAKYPELSGGQLQRIAVARSLITNPGIILMDEPYGALDVHTRFRMQQLIRDLFNRFEMTIIFVTHDIQEAVLLGDDIYIMRKDPGYIDRHYHVDLPQVRTKDTKRSPYFVNLVGTIDDEIDKMISLNQ